MGFPWRGILAWRRRQASAPSWERIVTLHEQAGQASRACADIFRMLFLGGANADDKAFLLASAVESEGKTTMALHLSAMLATREKRVLLADVHWQRPTLGRVMGVAGRPGLTDLLHSGGDLEKLFVPDARLPRLSVLPRGTAGLGLQDGLEERLASLLHRVKGAFDFVFLDGGPVSSGSEALIPSRVADGVVMVTACDRTQQTQVAAAQQTLAQHGGKLAGVILNRVPRYLPDYYRTV
jgi:Mrp family chromosome partitioning ATPase